MTAHSYCSADL